MGLADTKLIQQSTPRRPIAGADDSTSSALVVRGLRKGYGRQPVLWDLDFTLGWGECVALFGANGAGKTTLLKVVSTQARADAGTVRVAQHDVRTQTTLAARHIGLVSHRHMLYEDMTGTENLRFYGRMFGLNDLHQRIAEVLSILRMEHRGQQRVRSLPMVSRRGWRSRGPYSTAPVCCCWTSQNRGWTRRAWSCWNAWSDSGPPMVRACS